MSDRFSYEVAPGMSGALVGVIMGSQSDWATMRKACEVLDEFGVPFQSRIVSAHRTPERMHGYARSAKAGGIKVIIAGAGGAAHLPGMTAGSTILPVLGVPIRTSALSGVDSLYSILQMPRGIPVGTLAIGDAGAANAALLAIGILALSDPQLASRLEEFRRGQTAEVAEVPQD